MIPPPLTVPKREEKVKIERKNTKRTAQKNMV